MIRYLICLIILCGSAFATNAVYIAQAAAGSNNGLDCADAKVYTYFNTVGNWSATPSGIQIGPDTTVHLCGTITGTGTAATNVLTTQGAGTSGHPVIIFFEAGAKVQLPSCGTFSTNPTGGCIDVQNQWVTVDGNSLQGTVQSTANGSSSVTCISGSACTLDNPTAGVYVAASNVVVQNLNVINNYLRAVCQSAEENNAQDGIVIDASGGSAFTNVTVQGNVVNDGSGPITIIGGGTAISNMSILHNTINNFSAGIVLSEGGGASTATNTIISYNDLGGIGWWDSADADHLNGMHLFAAATGTAMTGVQVDHNYFHINFKGSCGGGGSHTTAVLFIETTGGGTATSVKVFDNVFVSVANDNASGGDIGIGDNNDSGSQVYNNFITHDATTGKANATCMQMTGTSIKMENNICVNANYGIFLNGSGTSQVTLSDHNDFFNFNNLRAGASVQSFATWQANGASFDPNSITTDPLVNVSAPPYNLQVSSPALTLGANLTSLSIAGLNLGAPDTFGAAGACGTGCISLPGAGSWPAGAYGATSGLPAAISGAISSGAVISGGAVIR